MKTATMKSLEQLHSSEARDVDVGRSVHWEHHQGHKAMMPGFDRAFRNLGAAPSQGPDAEGACPLLFCNVAHYVLVNS